MAETSRLRWSLSPLRPFGVEVCGIDIAATDAADHESLRDVLAENGVMVMREQTASDAEFVRFLRRFGPLAFTAGETEVDGRPELNVVTNVGRETTPVSNWHVDTAYVDEPPAYTALRAVAVPERGGATLFADQRAALDSLPADTADTIRGRTLTHVVTGVDPGPGEQTEAAHPLARPHPRTGRRALYLDAPARCAHVSGLGATESAELVADLLALSTRADQVLHHRWKPNDVVVWDNAVVLHRADHTDVVGDRTFHRGMVSAGGHLG